VEGISVYERLNPQYRITIPPYLQNISWLQSLSISQYLYILGVGDGYRDGVGNNLYLKILSSEVHIMSEIENKKIGPA
jgi:hypothetical protein